MIHYKCTHWSIPLSDAYCNCVYWRIGAHLDYNTCLMCSTVVQGSIPLCTLDLDLSLSPNAVQLFTKSTPSCAQILRVVAISPQIHASLAHILYMRCTPRVHEILHHCNMHLHVCKSAVQLTALTHFVCIQSTAPTVYNVSVDTCALCTCSV